MERFLVIRVFQREPLLDQTEGRSGTRGGALEPGRLVNGSSKNH